MKKLFLPISIIFIFLFLIVSCKKKSTLHEYNTVIDSVDSFHVYWFDSIGKKIISRGITSENEVGTFKSILKRNIKEEPSKDFKANFTIDVFKKDSVIASFLISTDKGFVNYKSSKLNFGFKLTYGIGMSL